MPHIRRYDTPGVVVMNRLHAMLPPRELTELLPTKQMRILTYAAPLRSHCALTDSAVEWSAVVDRRRYRVEPGQSLLLGGSVRATLRTHPHSIRSDLIRSVRRFALPSAAVPAMCSRLSEV